MMEILLANSEDLAAVQRFDSHIPLERLAQCIQNERVYILRSGENVVGVMRYSLFWQTIPFLDLIVLEERIRGRGHGSNMMARWEEDMKEQGFRHVFLSTQADETAQYFYEKRGYRKMGSFLPPLQDAQELMFLKEL